MMIYRNNVSFRFVAGSILAIISVSLGIVLLGVMVDQEAGLFDVPGIIFSTIAVALIIVSVQYWKRVAIARILASVVLHAFVLFVVAAWLVAMFDKETFETASDKIMLTSFCFYLAGVAALGIVCLHSDALKDEFSKDPGD